MTKPVFLFALTLTTSTVLAQVSGNANYQNRVSYPANNIEVAVPSGNDLVVSVSGLSNVLADSYIAVFNVTQTAETMEEANRLIDERITNVKSAIQNYAGMTPFVDMISFVPVYEYEVDKKLFNEDTYNEIPKGFEIVKNLHIEYEDPQLLNEMMSICAKAEIYDLVKVDYLTDSLEQKKTALMERAHALVKERLESYKDLLETDMANWKRQLNDGFKVVYPVEMYRSYQAHNSASLDFRKSLKASRAEKNTTLYYQPVMDKEFDFVMNPGIVQPVIQVMYEVKVRLHREQDAPENQYILITPSGETRNLDLGN